MTKLLANFCVIWVVLTLGFLASEGDAQNLRKTEKEILDKILSTTTYDTRIRPNGSNDTNGPVVVKVNFLVRSIQKFDDVNMDYTAQLTFRQQWTDDRLKFDDMSGQIRYLVLNDPSKIWRPDLFFKNEKEGHFHSMLEPNVLMRIYPDGKVLYSLRITAKFSCPMNLKFFPHDSQVCSIYVASYGYTTDDIVFLWKENDPVQVSSHLNLPRVTLQKFLTDYCTSKTTTGSYSCIKTDFEFKREFSYYLVQIYIPCVMLILVSWTAFWIDPKHVTARFVILIPTLFTMAAMVSFYNTTFSPVSYTKSVDVWTGICLTFVFLALLETCTVIFLIDNHPSDDANPIVKRLSQVKLDIVSRIVFPVVFLLFVIIYWIAYV